MIKQGSALVENAMHFDSDRHTHWENYVRKEKSGRRRADRKRKKQLIKNELAAEL